MGYFQKFTIFIILVFLLLFPVIITSIIAEEVVNNPYKNVQWDKCEYHKANLHTHTKRSDGKLSPLEVISLYKKRGYSILALTDHNKNTMFRKKGKEHSAKMGMVLISGCEASKHHHMNSFFCDYNGYAGSIQESLSIVKNKNGLAQINHPGRYSKQFSWYKKLYQKYDILVSLEVYNQGDRYSNDRKLWDDLLTETMPKRAIWGTSNDDMHKRNHIGRNWQIMILPENGLNKKNVRSAYRKGCFFACYDKFDKAGNIVIPESIKIKNRKIVIKADCSQEQIRWISEGEEVARGPELSLDSDIDLGSYVRVVLYGKNGARTLLQPIGLRDSQ